MTTGAKLDLIIVGGGIGGVICLKYAKDAGLEALLLERAERIGGLWRDLPAWQDIQFRKEDWTLGDLPLAGEDQASILKNIEAWVSRFDLSPAIRTSAEVVRARPDADGWSVATASGEHRSRFLVAATGGHNRAIVPQIERADASVRELHSSRLRDPEELRNKSIAVVGGGASAYDILDLCFSHGARRVAWIYRSAKWMRPTLQPKYFGTDMRWMSKMQMLGVPRSEINRRFNRDLRRRYARAGIEDIMPEGEFDIGRDQIVPGRRGMIRNFRSIERHVGEPRHTRGGRIGLSTGASVEADLLLWATGYAVNLDYLGVAALSRAAGLNAIVRRCSSAFRSNDAPNLFLMAPGVLETNTSTPWAYAHAAKSIMSHILGSPVFEEPPREALTNHFDLVKMLAPRDRRSYRPGLWYLKYLLLALLHPRGRPMPLP